MNQKLKSILIRAFKTFCQTAVSMIAVGVGMEDLNWIRILSVSTVAFIASVLTNIGGTPETNPDGTITFTNTDTGDVMARFSAKGDKPLVELVDLYTSGKQYVTMEIVDKINS